MGKNTYKIAASSNLWPYEGKRVIVLSSTLSLICNKAEIDTGDIPHLIKNFMPKAYDTFMLTVVKPLANFWMKD